MKYYHWESIADALESLGYIIYCKNFLEALFINRETIFERIDEALVDLYVNQKKSFAEIAQLLGTTKWFVRQHLLDNNVELRPRGGNQYKNERHCEQGVC